MSATWVKWLVTYVVAALVFAVVDAVWIAVVAGPQYQRELGHLMAGQADMRAAVVFYALFVVGIVHFGIRPLDDQATLPSRLGNAALFGGVAYATWALTGKAVLEGFPMSVAVLDIAWGAAVCALVTGVTCLILGRTLTRGSQSRNASTER